jgi:hypothetical protein
VKHFFVFVDSDLKFCRINFLELSLSDVFTRIGYSCVHS